MPMNLSARHISPDITTLSTPFKPYTLKFGGRCTIIRIPLILSTPSRDDTSAAVDCSDAKTKEAADTHVLAVFSPIPLTEEVLWILSGLKSPVRYLIAMNMEHYLSIYDWKSVFPAAVTIGPEGLQEKHFSPKFLTRTYQQMGSRLHDDGRGSRSLKFDFIFTPYGVTTRSANSGVGNPGATGTPISTSRYFVDPTFDHSFKSHYIPNHFNRELIFLHIPSKTLIQGDLWFNLPAFEQWQPTDSEDPASGVFIKVVMKIHGSKGSSKLRRRYWWVMSRGRMKELGKDVRGFLGNQEKPEEQSWQFESIIPCHGDVLMTGGQELFEDIFSCFLESEDRGSTSGSSLSKMQKWKKSQDSLVRG